jgi:exosortase/archaeosortase family protein
MITPGCSSISSITVFLLLCGLMHIDLRKSLSTTILMAFLGTVSLIVLNIMRIVILLWVGYIYGDWSMWNIHSWLGYAIFLCFYAIATKIYIKI